MNGLPQTREEVRIKRLELALGRIWELCHIPSGSRHAYTHFQADFDEIRNICKEHVPGVEREHKL